MFGTHDKVSYYTPKKKEKHLKTECKGTNIRIRINIGETVSELSLFLYKYVCVFIYIYIYIYKLVKGISIAYKVDKF